MKRFTALLIALALLAGTVGCPAAPVQVELNVSSTPGGSVTGPGEGTYTYGAGTVVDLAAEAEQGYRFVNWTGDVDTVENVNAASTSIIVEGDYTVTANFIAEYNLAISSTEGGQVTIPGEGTFTYEGGAAVSLVAEAGDGHRFVNWTGGADITDRYSPVTTVTVNGDYSIIANFVAVYELTISSAEGGSVTVPGEGTFAYDEGAVVGLVAAANVGHRFVSWSGDVDAVADVTAASTTISISGDYSITAAFGEDEVVSFVDPYLEKAVRETIGIRERPIYALDMERLTALDGVGRGISSLSGLEYGGHLRRLDLTQNQISDISPLTDLTKLTELVIGNNQISDISPLAGLTSLVGLSLWGNRISDISALESLTNLTWLSLEANQLSDISPLAHLTNLTELGLMRNEISDLSPLDYLTRLRDLSVTINSVSDVSLVPNVANLTALGLSFSQISDAELHQLADLKPKLRRLWLTDNQLSDISALASLTNLQALWLANNQLSDISPLASVKSLEHLHIWNNPISDISPLESLTNLNWLGLRQMKLGDISPLAGLTRLLHLHIENNRISDVSSLAGLTNLTDLSLSHNQISDISPLSGLTKLTTLYLGSNQISDISPLAGLTRLRELSLGNNQIGDISALQGLVNLTFLYLPYNEISDIKPLVDNAGVRGGDVVDLRENPLSEESINEHMPALRARGVTVDY